MDKLQSYLEPAFEYLKNPYVVGVVAILAIVYGGLMAPQLPPTVAAWFGNPIFKVLFIFLILAVRNYNPTVAILLTLGLIISMQTLNRYRVFTMANEVSQMTAEQSEAKLSAQMNSGYQQPSPEELKQMHQELSQEMQGHPSEQAAREAEAQAGASLASDQPPNAEQQAADALHPKNRPTAETQYVFPRVEHPNDPSHPGWQRLNTPNVDAAIYELNPPFLRKNLPNQHRNPGGAVVENPIYPPQFSDKIASNLPRSGATRYSATHGYPVVPQVVPQAGGAAEDPKMRTMQRDLNDNMLNPVVPESEQQLPTTYGPDPVRPNPQSMGYQVGTKLHAGSDAYSGPQGLQWPAGQVDTCGARYGLETSEI
jgi:hypothetical protein